MSLTVTGDCMVFRKDFDDRPAYSIGISKKNADGTYDKSYFPAQFKKDVVVENMTKIDIKNAWFSFFTSKDGTKKPYLFIGEFAELMTKEKYDDIPSGFSVVTDDDIPF